MTQKRTLHVVPKEEAVFWLDRNGRWHNTHGEFEHRKIIDYFHSAIRKDKDGFHLFQEHDEQTAEKVYFNYEDTPLFVFDIEPSDDGGITLVLNTKARLPLDPSALFVQNDQLYVRQGEDRIRFVERSLLKISDRLEFEKNAYRLRFKGEIFDIPERRV